MQTRYINYSMNLKNESFLIFETGGSIYLSYPTSNQIHHIVPSTNNTFSKTIVGCVCVNMSLTHNPMFEKKNKTKLLF